MNNHMSRDLLERLLNDIDRMPVDAVCIIYPSSTGQCAFGVTRPADLPFHTGDFIRFLMASGLKTNEEIRQELTEALAEMEECS